MSFPKGHGRRARIASAAIDRPIGTVMLISVLIVLGTFFFTRLSLDLLPSIVYPTIRVSVTNQGVEPNVMEETVARPLEAALATTENVTHLETTVNEGLVGINLHFSVGTDMDFALQDAATNLERVRRRLPEEADPPTVRKFDPSQIAIYEVAFSSSSRDLIALREWAELRLQPQLLAVEGVASVDVAGGLEREIQVVLDQERLRSYNLAVSHVMEALRSANQDVAAGRLVTDTREVVGKTAGKFRSPEEIRQLLIRTPGGGRIPLREVADVRDTHQEQRLWARLDGQPAVRLSVRKQPEANTVAVAEAVDRRIASLAETGFIPSDISYRTLEDQAGFIRNSINAVRNAALAGALLAMTVVLLFLGALRKTFIVGLAIPIAVLATFLMMGLGGLTLNIMTLGALALGVGLLIDNSIVMLENIFRHRDMGKSPDDAAHEGAGEVQGALIAATATNLAAVVPFILIAGLAAMIFREMILTISFAILASLLVGLTLVPTLARQFAKVRFSSGLGETRALRGVQSLMDTLRNWYRYAVTGAVRRRWAVIVCGVLVLGGSFALTRDLGSIFLPRVDDGGVGIMIRLPPGSSADRTNRITLEVEEMVRGMPHVDHMFTTAGGMLWGGATAARAGRGSISVRLSPRSERDMSADAWVARLQSQLNQRGFPEARIFVRPPRIRGLRTSMAGADIALTVQGDDLTELRRLAESITEMVHGVPGLQNLEPSAEEVSPQLSVELDRERASYLGLNVATVGAALRTALDGTVATRYTEGNREFDVRVMFPRERFASNEDLEGIALFPANREATMVNLRDVATVRPAVGPTSILRENQNRILRLTGDVLTDIASVGEVSDSIRARLAGLELPEGYAILYGGEEEAIRESNRQLATVVLLAIFMVFVVLAVQYESLVNPLVILLAIPFSLMGVGITLWATATPLSAPVLLGVILLAGIVVNNSILLVEYTEQFRRDQGASPEEAVVQAGVIRLRPILMTTLTTCFGMSPLALGFGQGSELMQPLAIAVVGGLSVSMLLTLFIVPSGYVIIHRAADSLKFWLTGQSSASEAGVPGTPTTG